MAMTTMRMLREYGLYRRGSFVTPHGVVETPCFMPIATLGAVKTLAAPEVTALGASVILANTYHVLVRLGEERMRALGGMHTFMGHAGPLLTDSGGFQVFSLARLNRIDDDGVTFQSHIDGKRQRLTPESSIAMQSAMGADILMQFDDVAAGGATRERSLEAMERSLRWAERSKIASLAFSAQESRPLLFGIVQGGTHDDLRAQSLAGLLAIGFDGYAIGGLSVGEARPETFRVVNNLVPMLPKHVPRYFMGGGMPEEILFYVAHGVDMFDCVLPTRNARHGTLFVWKGDPRAAVREAFCRVVEGASDRDVAHVLYERLHITNERFALDVSPIDPWNDGAPFSQMYSKAYLRHLFAVGETLALRIASMQNLRWYLRLMEELRALLVE